ncbi:MAG: type I DNA topoisomerase [Leptospiraceae bacterium]|nr:type I DNA topoisomerase [Leptospiraceae bacterium]MDW7975365.1 type I DNA topoisomerase [Leptospiraceae bacterium]
MKSKKQKIENPSELKDKTLVVVESPAKAKTINKYLGKNYIVEACMGHVMDLPKSRLGVNVNNGFEPEYLIIRGRAKILNHLKKIAELTKGVLLATDPDREGEAISYHIAKILQEKNSNIKRVEFHEITESGIKKAMQSPRDINMNLVNSQQARRILDRLVGYNISPILWKKIKKGLSAGRVQSVALRLICEREEEIQNFIPEEYWTIEAEFSIDKKKLKTELIQIQGKKPEIKNQEQAEEIQKKLPSISNYIIHSIKTKERKRQPTAPYTTSKLQQDASNRLGFTSQKTMMIAQQLYEGVEVEGTPVGLITYMRTDSTRVSEEAIQMVRNYIQEKIGKEYLSSEVRVFSKASKNAQEAHEAIRPTNVEFTPERVQPYLDRDQFRLYQLIWQKFVASQMAEEISETTSIDILGISDQQEEFVFRANFKKVKFKGFTLIYQEEDDEETGKELLLQEGSSAKLLKVIPKQHFTQPPPRYTDATLVKVLEESGVGRPSTYAPTIQTLLKRYYVVRQQRALKTTELGILVNKMLVEYFPELVDIQFTAKMEEELDQIANSEMHWVDMLKKFYDPFMKKVEHAQAHMQSMRSFLEEPTDVKCDKCGRPMVKKIGRNGYFLACSGFPECTNAKPIPLGKCPKCEEGDIIAKTLKKQKGRVFYGCSRYPDCEFTTWDKPVENRSCPLCGKLLLEKTEKQKGKYIACSSCTYIEIPEEAQTISALETNLDL